MNLTPSSAIIEYLKSVDSPTLSNAIEKLQIRPRDQGFTPLEIRCLFTELGRLCGYAKVCLDEAIAYARERHTFGKPLIANQVVRHRLVDMAMRVNAVKSTLELLAWRVSQGEKPVAEICLLKNLATSTLEFCANEAMQVFGGAGYLRGAKVERIYRETKVMSIGGGSTEIMKDLAARQMGL